MSTKILHDLLLDYSQASNRQLVCAEPRLHFGAYLFIAFQEGEHS
jgi:hypothetical protein